MLCGSGSVMRIIFTCHLAYVELRLKMVFTYEGCSVWQFKLGPREDKDWGHGCGCVVHSFHEELVMWVITPCENAHVAQI